MNKAIKDNSIVNDPGNPLYPLGLPDVANAKTDEELSLAIEHTLSAIKQFGKINPLRDYQETVKAFLKDPSNEELGSKLGQTIQKCANAVAVRNGNKLREVVSDLDKEAVDEIRDSLITQYNATGAAEIMLVDVTVSSYFRILRLTQAHNILITSSNTNASQEQVNFIKEIGKQIDSAQRQFAIALTMLKELHQPPLKVRIQTKEAYIANNQQFNNKPLNDLGRNL